MLEILILVIFLMCVVLGPLLVFAPQLAQAKRLGEREYGKLAERYVREFDAKWLRGGAPPNEPLVGSGDIQSLADLGNSFEVVRNDAHRTFYQGNNSPARGRDTCADSAAVTHHDAVGRSF